MDDLAPAREDCSQEGCSDPAQQRAVMVDGKRAPFCPEHYAETVRLFEGSKLTLEQAMSVDWGLTPPPDCCAYNGVDGVFCSAHGRNITHPAPVDRVAVVRAVLKAHHGYTSSRAYRGTKCSCFPASSLFDSWTDYQRHVAEEIVAALGMVDS